LDTKKKYNITLYKGNTPFWAEFFLSNFTPLFKLFYNIIKIIN